MYITETKALHTRASLCFHNSMIKSEKEKRRLEEEEMAAAKAKEESENETGASDCLF